MLITLLLLLRYVDRLADSLQQKLKTANNLLRQAKAMTERRKAAHELQIETEPKLEGLIKKTKELKQQVGSVLKLDMLTENPNLPLTSFEEEELLVF